MLIPRKFSALLEIAWDDIPRRNVIIFLILFGAWNAKGQIVTSSFTLSDSVCLGQNLSLTNTSVNSLEYQWDFCFEDLITTPAAQTLTTISEGDFMNSITIQYDQGNWYGFVSNRGNHKLLRLDFGNSLDNVPTVVDLGTFGIFNVPRSLVLRKESGTWYGLITSINNSSLIRLNFGGSLGNVPTATNLGSFSSLNQPFGLDLIEEPGQITAVVTNFGSHDISLIDFGSSIANNPVGADALKVGGTGDGFNRPLGVSVIQSGTGIWYGVVANFQDGKVFRLKFNSTIKSVPQINQIGTISGNGSEVKLIKEGLGYKAFALSMAAGLFRYSFGADLESVPQVTGLGTFGVLTDVRSLDIAYTGKDYRGFICHFSTTNKNLYKFTFTGSCSDKVSLNSSIEFEPGNIKHNISGDYPVSLTSYGSNGNRSIHTDTIVVKDIPAPPISFTTDNACIENTNIFTASSTEESSITEWNWSFGDTSTSTDQNPTHQYDIEGVYSVQLSVEAENGCSNTVRKVVPIFPPPVPDFDFDAPLPCSNTELAMINQTETHGADTLISYFWNFNDEFTSNAQDTTLYFESGGSKAVTLSASIPGCTEEITKNIEIIDGPAVSFDWSGVCLGELTVFDNQTTGNGITSYLWDFGDGFSSNLQQPSHLYVEGGNYSVSLKVDNADGCENTIIRTVQIGNIPSADFTNELACSEQDIQFFDASSVVGANISTYRWYHENTLLSTQEDPLLSFQNSGFQNVSLAVVSNIGCVDSVTKAVEILPAPIVAIIEDVGCASEASTFTANSTTPSGSITSNTWVIDGNVFLEDEVEYLFGSPGEYEVTLISRASNLCQQSLTNTIDIYPLPTADFEYSDPCTNEDILFTSTSVSVGDPLESYSWTLGGQVISFEETFRHQVAEAGTQAMMLEVSTANNCVNAVTKNIVVNQAPTASFTAVPATGAPPLEVTFNNTSTNASEYVWDFSESNDDQDFEKNTFYVYNSIGVETATLVASNEFNCTDTARVNIELVDPVMDMSIEEVIQNVNDDRINFIIRIRNRGTLVVQNPDIKIRFNDAIEISEQVDHTFIPGALLSYPLSFSLLNMPMDNISHICFEIATPTISDIDILPSNNAECVNLGGEFVVVNPYPNPAVESMRIPLILPEKQDVTVRMMNSEGSIVFQQTFKDTKTGLNVIRLDVSTLARGSYLLSLSYSGQSTVKKVMVR